MLFLIETMPRVSGTDFAVSSATNARSRVFRSGSISDKGENTKSNGCPSDNSSNNGYRIVSKKSAPRHHTEAGDGDVLDKTDGKDASKKPEFDFDEETTLNTTALGSIGKNYHTEAVENCREHHSSLRTYSIEERDVSPSKERKAKVTFGSDVKFNSTKLGKKRKRAPKRFTSKGIRLNSSTMKIRGEKKEILSPNLMDKESRRNSSLAPSASTSFVKSPGIAVKGNASNDTLLSNKSWIPRRGIGVDTRALETFAGDAVGRTFQNHTVRFLQSCRQQGLLPSVLGTTAIKTPGKRQQLQVTRIGARRVPICFDEKVAGADKNDETWKELLALVCVRPPNNVDDQSTTNKANNIPKSFTANESWKIVGDLGKVN